MESPNEPWTKLYSIHATCQISKLMVKLIPKIVSNIIGDDEKCKLSHVCMCIMITCQRKVSSQTKMFAFFFQSSIIFYSRSRIVSLASCTILSIVYISQYSFTFQWISFSNESMFYLYMDKVYFTSRFAEKFKIKRHPQSNW